MLVNILFGCHTWYALVPSNHVIVCCANKLFATQQMSIYSSVLDPIIISDVDMLHPQQKIILEKYLTRIETYI